MGELSGLLVLMLVGLVVAVLILSFLMASAAVHPPRHAAGYAVARGLPVDPGEKGLAFEEWWIEVEGGASLPVWEVEQGTGVGGRGSGRTPTAVFVHGWGESRIDVLARLEPWADVCGRLVLFDLRGHGDAVGSPSRLGYKEEKDLIALLERLGGGRFVLVGTGLGAIIAIAAAAGPSAVRDRILGVVAAGIYRDFHWWFRDRLRARGLPTRPLSDLAMLWLRLRGLRFPDTEVEATALACPLLDLDGTDEQEPAWREFVERLGVRVAEACDTHS